ncbi:hypothetical protein [Phaeobacter inhibens]|uniref:hypothetical protein n=1 Tax=Phaeobacter inhibens TaxID=221822 RepID=UPI00295E6458|nr:hypothetical protein [Phaeobacter inhibens]
MRIIPLFFIACLLGAISLPAHANPLNRWKVSCGADKGSITKQGKTRIFRTSANHCPGGIFNQRAEISTDKVRPNHKGRYLFSSTISMTNTRNDRFGIFQIHDGRHGCAPPLSVLVRSDGRFKLQADYKTGPGESCIRDVFRQNSTSVRFKRDGRPQKLEVLIDFLGGARFDVQVLLDGKLAAQGQYRPPEGDGFIASKHFYFKHGVYSQHMFNYELISQDMKVRKVHQ